MAEAMTSPVPMLKAYNDLQELLLDKDLASLGDSYVNFVYSLAMSKKRSHPIGAKVKNQILADAVENSGLRKLLPHRVDKHERGNAAEALLVFAWLQDMQEIDDCVKVLSQSNDPTIAFVNLLRDALGKLGISHEHK
jgi:hypothetical protein